MESVAVLSLVFHYVIPFEEETLEHQSPFQGFTPGAIGAALFFPKILELPANAVELSVSREKVIAMRVSGDSQYVVIPMEFNGLEILPILPDSPFFIFLSNDDSYEAVESFVSSVRQPVLHVSTKDSKSTLKLDSLDRGSLFQYVSEVKDFYEKNGYHENAEFLRTTLPGLHSWVRESLAVPSYGHGCTLPNEMVLSSLEYDFDSSELLIGTDNEPYIKAILSSAKEVADIRTKNLAHRGHQLFKPSTISLILFVPSLKRQIYRTDPDLRRLETGSPSVIRGLLKAVIRQKTFPLLIDSGLSSEIMESSITRSVLSIRQQELGVSCNTVGIIGASNFSPTLRLQPDINNIGSNLIALGDCSRGKSPHKFRKLNRLMKKIRNQMVDMIDPRYMDVVSETEGHMKLICDIPLEWLPLDGLPLMLRKDTSRIPTTPGNLFLLNALPKREVIIPADAFKKVLVIRSFKEDDPVRNLLARAVEIFERNAYASEEIRPEIKFVDVKSEQEFVAAVNSYQEAPVLVFDGHGRHDIKSEIGNLEIGGQPVDVWQLRRKLNVPPIVLLSACDTHPVDRSHASVANGFIVLGARTVLGTFLPINASHAATFVARLIYRMAKFIHICSENGGVTLRWTTVITGLQRMSYMTELIRGLMAHKICEIRDEVYVNIGAQANWWINIGDVDWFKKGLTLICNETGVRLEEIQSFIDESFQIPESIRYVQIGNPEQILIPSRGLLESLEKSTASMLRD